MKTIMTFILMLFSILTASNSHANYTGKTEDLQGEGILIEVKNAVSHGGSDKSSSIQASIDGHYLTVVFLENLGTVHIEVTDTNGGAVALTDLYTPNGYNAYIYNTGSYIVTFTLTNGDEYYGEFEVTN